MPERRGRAAATAPASGGPFVVYTDLDGTLLDHHSYDFAPALPALTRLEALRVPVVIVTSKTRAEVEALRRALDNRHPFIVENGAATCIPHGYFPAGGGLRPAPPEAPLDVEVAGPGRAVLRELAGELRRRHGFRFRTFEELGVAGIREHTGLPADAARLANERDGSEPLLWQDGPEAFARFRDEVAAAGRRAVRGGRFVHVVGQTDKAAAVATLHARYERAAGGAALPRVVLGDGPNDLGMLAQADVAVVVRGEHDQPMPLENATGRVLRTRAAGPSGWAEAMQAVLRDFGVASGDGGDARPVPASESARHGRDEQSRED